MFFPGTHIVFVVTPIFGVRRIDIRQGSFPVVPVKTVSPVQAFDDDRAEAIMDRFEPITERFESASQAIAAATIGDAGLEARIVQFAPQPAMMR